MEAIRLSQTVQEALWSWNEAKQSVGQALAIGHDTLHLFIGVLLLLLAAALLRKPVSSWQPWLVVFAGTCLNELADLWVEEWPEPAMQYGEALKDLLLTMVLPTLLLVTTRVFPRLYESDKGRA